MVVSWKMRMCHQDFLLGIYIVVVGFFTPSSLVLQQQLASYGQCMIARLNSLQPWCRVRGHGQEERKKKIFWMFVGPSCRGQDYSRGQRWRLLHWADTHRTILSFLAYTTYSVARQKTTKAATTPDSPSNSSASSSGAAPATDPKAADKMENLKRAVGDAGTFLTRAVQAS